jgi:4-amino-4-deoxy-L-arabinose transferase-like glycosyltransferase
VAPDRAGASVATERPGDLASDPLARAPLASDLSVAAPGQPERGERAGRAACPSWAALLAIVVLGAILRMGLLGQRSIWLDEAVVVWVAQHPWREIPRLLATFDQHPPAYYLLMHVWQGIVGTVEAALRLPSACFGLTSVVLTYVLARRIATEATSLLSAFVVAVSPFQVMSAQEARMYALLGALCLASTIALVNSVDRGGARRWIAYVIASTVMAYTHYLGLLVLVAHGVWVAAWERRHLGSWTACAAATALGFAPWIPSFLEQLRQVHSFDWYHNAVLSLGLGDLLGLSAFGGSRWGMGTYFAPGTLAPAEQCVILLPFLVLLWRGAAGLAASRRSLALVGLPPAVTVGVMLGYSSLGRSMFVPRWFSFLLPFFAVFIARGIYDVAEHVTFPRQRIVPLLIGVLLLYELPVLQRYYFDPTSHSFNWRTAAATVRQMARPGDALVFVGKPASIPFTYYFREPYPSVDVTPTVEGFHLSDADAARLAARHPRLWIIAAVPFSAAARDRLLAELSRAYHVAGLRNFAGAIVYLLSAEP